MESQTNPKTETAIEQFREGGGDLLHLPPSIIQNKLAAIDAFQKIIHQSLIKELDYGIIPGTQKPTLYKGGAEKVAKLLNLADTYEIVDKVENWDKPFFSYTVRCTLTEISTGSVVSSYVASCNSYESKYRWRWVPQWKIAKGQNLDGVYYEDRMTKRGSARFYRFENDDIFSQVNTLLKMAEKRAMVSAVVSVGRLSLIFTVDMEDYHVPEPDGEGAVEQETKSTLGQSGDAAANVRPPAEEPPSRKHKTAFIDGYGHYSDDQPGPWPISLTLPDGTAVTVSRTKAQELLKKMETAVGKEKYYELLTMMKCDSADDMPDGDLHLFYSLLGGAWKQLKEKKGKK